MKSKSPIIFAEAYSIDKVIEDFLRSAYAQQLTYLASDLLDNGFQAEDIIIGMSRAMKICRNSEEPVERHFMPLYSDRNGVTVRDCKLSLLGYRLLLLNANPDHPATARFQIKILEQFNDQPQPHKSKR